MSFAGAVMSFDNQIRPREDRWWNPHAESTGSLEIDGKLVLGCLLQGEIGRPGAPEDLVDVGGGPAGVLDVIREVAHETARLDMCTPWDPSVVSGQHRAHGAWLRSSAAPDSW